MIVVKETEMKCMYDVQKTTITKYRLPIKNEIIPLLYTHYQALCALYTLEHTDMHTYIK